MKQEDTSTLLLRRISELETENWLLRKAMERDYPDVSSELKLPRREAQILGLLIEKTPMWVSKERLHSAMYIGSDYADVGIAVVESHVSKLGAKLKTMGVEMRRLRYHGYALTKEDAAYLKSLIGGVQLWARGR